MRHDTAEFHFAVVQRAADSDQFVAIRLESCTMPVAINLHPYLEHMRVLSPEFNDCVCRIQTINDDF